LVRSVERNAQRAARVKRAQDWPWSSVHVRLYGNAEKKKLLSPWPIAEPQEYRQWLNPSQPKEEIENIRYAIQRNRPYGERDWVLKAAEKFGLATTLPARGRPRKGT